MRSPGVSRAVGYYDEILRRVVLIGGMGQARAGVRDRVWSFTGTAWEVMSDSGPSARGVASGVYDTRRRAGVVTGGVRRTLIDSSFEVVSDDWQSTSHRTWAALRRGSAFAPRDHHAMVFDARRGRVLLFGGVSSDRPASLPTDSWELQDAGWVRVADDGPPGRLRTALAYDSRRKQVVLFGGVGASPGPRQPQPFFGDTWVWESRAWRKVTDSGPPGRYAHGMVFDEREGVVLLYSGAAAHRDAPLADMWKWDGTRWTEIKLSGPTPGFRYQPIMVYDRARKRTVLYGGLNEKDDTWEWDGRNWAQIPWLH